MSLMRYYPIMILKQAYLYCYLISITISSACCFDDYKELDTMQYKCVDLQESLHTHIMYYYKCVKFKTLKCILDVINYRTNLIKLSNYCGLIDAKNVQVTTTVWLIRGHPAILLDFIHFHLQHSSYECKTEQLIVQTKNSVEMYCEEDCLGNITGKLHTQE